jgi:hypothetical protein
MTITADADQLGTWDLTLVSAYRREPKGAYAGTYGQVRLIGECCVQIQSTEYGVPYDFVIAPTTYREAELSHQHAHAIWRRWESIVTELDTQITHAEGYLTTANEELEVLRMAHEHGDADLTTAHIYAAAERLSVCESDLADLQFTVADGAEHLATALEAAQEVCLHVLRQGPSQTTTQDPGTEGTDNPQRHGAPPDASVTPA